MEMKTGRARWRGRVRRWQVAVKWAGYTTPTWENQALVRKDLGAKAMETLMNDLNARPNSAPLRRDFEMRLIARLPSWLAGLATQPEQASWLRTTCECCLVVTKLALSSNLPAKLRG